MTPALLITDYFDPSNVRLDLRSTIKPDAIRELLETLGLEPKDESAVLRTILRREEMGSTGLGRGVAVPHGRTPLVSRLRLAYGRSVEGVAYEAMDGAPVHHIFLLVAPPVEVANEYLPVLGRIAHVLQRPEVPARLSAAQSAEDFLRVLREEAA